MEQYKWRVKKSERGTSLENYIYSKMDSWSHKQVKTAIDKKRAFVNGKNVFISKWNLKANAMVQFYPNQSDFSQETQSRYRFIDVVHEDRFVLATCKPAFIDFEAYAATVMEYLKRQNKNQGFPYLGQMHRLDKETSGMMLFTKKKVANKLAEQFREHTIQKFYYALVKGCVAKEQGTINKAIEKGEYDNGRKVRISKNGKSATTIFRVLERYPSSTLLQVEILTGRTHQIRIHMSDMGHPLVGDKVYGDPTEGITLAHHALHAERIDFKHPMSGELMKLRAPLPLDFSKLIDSLRDEV